MLSTDPIDFLWDINGNLTFVNGRPVMATGLAAIAQGQRIRMMNFAGEWFENLDDGVPWFERDGVTAQQAILGQPYDVNKLLNDLRAPILATPGTTTINYLTAVFNPQTRKVAVTYQTTTIFGDTPVDTLEVPVPATS